MKKLQASYRTFNFSKAFSKNRKLYLTQPKYNPQSSTSQVQKNFIPKYPYERGLLSPKKYQKNNAEPLRKNHSMIETSSKMSKLLQHQQLTEMCFSARTSDRELKKGRRPVTAHPNFFVDLPEIEKNTSKKGRKNRGSIKKRLTETPKLDEWLEQSMRQKQERNPFLVKGVKLF